LFGLSGGKSKKKLQGKKPKMTYITGGKDLLTLKYMRTLFSSFLCFY